MNTLRLRLANLPIKWKLTLLSSLLLFVLFAIYNAVQYQVVNQWMMQQEEYAIRQTMNEIQSYFTESNAALDTKQIVQNRSFIEKLNQKNQMIRVVDQQGHSILTVMDDLPEKWVVPKSTTVSEMSSMWHTRDHLLILREPIVTSQFVGTIEIAKNLENFDKLNDIIFLVMILGGLGAIILSGLGGLLLARQLLRPIQSITETMRLIKHKDLHERVIWKDNKDEISKLTKMFNEMMDQLETSFQQQKQFVEDASHELRTPIAIIGGHLSLLQRWGKKEPAILEESLQASMQELNRLQELVQELLVLTRAERVLQGPVYAAAYPAQTIQMMVRNMSILHPDFQFDTELDKLEDIKIAISAQYLEQILLILLDNAVKYSLDNKTVQIKGTVLGERVHILVIDFGIGIPDDELPYVFDRFYRVDKARSREQGGHGLGLSIAKQLVEKYHGTLLIQSTENKGTKAEMSFPISS